MRLMQILLIVSLVALSGCAAPGDFCDVVRGPILMTGGTAARVVATDRAAAEAIDTQNSYGRRNCSGWKFPTN